MTVELFDGYILTCDVIQMGRDYTLAVYGGSCPHIGSTVLSVARPSLTGEGVSVTTSVLSCMGHKEEAVARLFAETFAREKACTAVCTCGIHIDALTPDKIKLIQEKSRQLLRKLL